MKKLQEKIIKNYFLLIFFVWNIKSNPYKKFTSVLAKNIETLVLNFFYKVFNFII